MILRNKIILSLLVSIGLGRVAFAQVVDIPDASLRAAVREELQLPAGAPIVQEDMRQLKRLETLRAGIKTLKGLEFATELEQLGIPLSPISDLTPVSGLVKLNHLDASGCHIVDISPLAISQTTSQP